MKRTTMLNILEKMLLIRQFEYKIAKLAEMGEIKCPVHLSVGQEAVSSAICEILDVNDNVYSTHRNHGHYLAKDGNIKKLMAEIYCKETGCSKGRGGSMHVIDRDVNFMGSSAIVSGSIPIAVGNALSNLYLGNGQVSVAFFGDGATDEGIFYESINLAVLYNLPILFVCENNDFATHLPNCCRQANIHVYDRVKGFNINAKKVDGNNPIEIFQVASKLVNKAKNNKGPSLIECVTYRWLSHAGYWKDIDVGFRKKEDVEYWMNKCPIEFLKKELKLKNKLNDNDLDKMKNKINIKIQEAVNFARNSSKPNKLC